MDEARDSLAGFVSGVGRSLRSIDRRLFVVLISTALLEILSHYYAGRNFFRQTFGPTFTDEASLNFAEYVYWFLADFVVQFLIPLALIRFALRQPLRAFGLGAGNIRLGLKTAVLLWLLFLPVLWVVSSLDSFQLTYPHARVVRTDWNLFLLYELCLILYMIGWEFIWRGYLLFGLRERLGDVAILVQMIPFVLLHFGKPVLETGGAVAGAIALGYLALRTGSFWYGVLTHVLVICSIDVLATLRFRTGNFRLNPLGLLEMIRSVL